jgi:hypothetical protein
MCDLKSQPVVNGGDGGGIDDQESGVTHELIFIDPKIEKRLKLKADLILLPTLAFTYLFK